jgi:hypothetical protein
MSTTRVSHSRRIRLVLPLLAAMSLVPCAHANAQQSVNVIVRVERTSWNGCDDGIWSMPDMYYKIKINGTEQTTAVQDDCCNIAPWEVDQEVTQSVLLSTGNVEIVIAQYDSDSGALGGDDTCDINPVDGVTNLTLNLNLTTCAITGDATGTCNESIVLFNDDMDFEFKIWVEYPVGNMRCTHTPIWPQAGQAVTLRAAALDAFGNALTGYIDNIEILVDNASNVVARTTDSSSTLGQNALQYTFTPATGSTHIDYLCRVTDGGLTFAGPWRVTQIGNPPSGIQTVPVLYTGSSSGAIDICFIPDRLSYTGPQDVNFLTDVETVVRDVYYAQDTTLRAGGVTFLTNQDKLNFWVSLQDGQANNWPTSHGFPQDWDTKFSLCDSGAIIHTTALRDHASRSNRIFSSGVGSLDNFLHELGHSPFGLADEYCCDGGYFQTDERPNVYEKLADCQADELIVNGTISSAFGCSSLTDVNSNVWHILDPSNMFANDLMRDAGNHTSRAAELRRINWLFGRCNAGGC